jgi:KDO2-lipid IV(A) lauroyltransferase
MPALKGATFIIGPGRSVYGERKGRTKGGVLKTPPIYPSTSRSFAARIPDKYIANAGRLLGVLAYVLDRRHRRIVKRNLQFTHPDWPSHRVRELSKDVFQHMGMTALECLQMTRLSREDILRKVRIRGQENLLEAVSASKGAILVSAHFGNWEMAHIVICCFLQTPLVLVARWVRPRRFNEWVCRLRSRFGSVVLDKAGAIRKMARALRRAGIVALLIDQGTLRSEGVEIRFFGKTVTATPAAALLARRYDSPVLPACCIREKDGGLTLIVEPPLPLKRTNDIRGDLQVNTQIMNDAIERLIRAYPEQWFWFHKRWKRHYPHLYPEDLAMRRRQKEKRRAGLPRMGQAGPYGL